MGNTTPPVVRLDAAHNQNWNADAGPVAVLNEASTVHKLDLTRFHGRYELLH